MECITASIKNRNDCQSLLTIQKFMELPFASWEDNYRTYPLPPFLHLSELDRHLIPLPNRCSNPGRNHKKEAALQVFHPKKGALLVLAVLLSKFGLAAFFLWLGARILIGLPAHNALGPASRHQNPPKAGTATPTLILAKGTLFRFHWLCLRTSATHRHSKCFFWMQNHRWRCSSVKGSVSV